MPAKTSHTPGPWHVGMRNGHNANIVFAYTGKGDDAQYEDKGVCEIYGLYMHATVEDIEKSGQCDEGLANARLIAAAPDLMAALKASLALLEYMASDRESAMNHNTLVGAREAIRRAEGGTP